MKYRWIGGMLVAAAMTLGACAPPDSGGGATSTPDQEATEASDAPTTEPESGTPEPAEYGTDEY